MIWLPGVLSQGGEKFTWARYSVSYEMTRTYVKERAFSFSGGMTIDIFAGYNFSPSNGKFSLPKPTTSITAGDAFAKAYSASDGGFPDYYSKTTSGLSVIYEYEYVSCAIYGDTPTYTLDMYKLEAQTIRGDLLDVVSDTDPSAYPENGVQGSYWYVKFSDTPITWERYATSEGEVQGADVEQQTTSSTYFYRATSYSRSGKTFSASVSRTQARSLAANNYLIQSNGAFVKPSGNATSGTVSGDTLFKITAKSGSSTVKLTFATYTVGDVKGSYLDTVTSYNPYEFPDDGAQDGYWYVKIS